MYILNPAFIKELAVFYQKSVPVPIIKCFRYCGFKKKIWIMSPKMIQIKIKNQQNLLR